MVLLAGLASCATQPSLTKTDEAIVCRGVAVEPMEENFKTASAIRYRVVFEGDLQVCNPSGEYDGRINYLRTLELRRDTGQMTRYTVESFPRPVRFDRLSRDKAGRENVFGNPNLTEFKDENNMGTVEAGRYVLAMKFRTGHCNRKEFVTTCVVTSTPFAITHSTSFAEEE